MLSRAREGKLHDKRFEAEEEIAFHIPDEIAIEVDLGFQGVQSAYINIRIPRKKLKEGELAELQKQENRSLNQSQLVCENAFLGIQSAAMRAIYRNRIEDFDAHLMLTASKTGADKLLLF